MVVSIQVMFIATANVKTQIPGPLRDRLEIIDFSLLPNLFAAHRQHHPPGLYEARVGNAPFPSDLLSGIAKGLARAVIVKDDLSSMIDDNHNV